jgi:hypothetical protein
MLGSTGTSCGYQFKHMYAQRKTKSAVIHCTFRRPLLAARVVDCQVAATTVTSRTEMTMSLATQATPFTRLAGLGERTTIPGSVQTPASGGKRIASA